MTADAPPLPVWMGIVLVLVSASAFAAAPNLAVLAYESGSNPNTVALLRFWAGCLLTMAVLLARHELRVPRGRARGWFLVAGLFYAGAGLAYLTAIRYVSIGIAVTVFYLYPFVVVVLSRLYRALPLTRRRLIGLVGALLGVALVSITGEGQVVPVGVVLGLIAAISTGAFIFVGHSLSNEGGVLWFVCWASVVAGAILTPWVLLAGEVALPQTGLGWAAFVGCGTCYFVGIMSFFIAMTIVDPVRASIVANAEPVLAIVIAGVLLGQVLTGTQWLGAALVVVAVTVGSLRPREGTLAVAVHD